MAGLGLGHGPAVPAVAQRRLVDDDGDEGATGVDGGRRADQLDKGIGRQAGRPGPACAVGGRQRHHPLLQCADDRLVPLGVEASNDVTEAGLLVEPVADLALGPGPLGGIDRRIISRAGYLDQTPEGAVGGVGRQSRDPFEIGLGTDPGQLAVVEGSETSNQDVEMVRTEQARPDQRSEGRDPTSKRGPGGLPTSGRPPDPS